MAGELEEKPAQPCHTVLLPEPDFSLGLWVCVPRNVPPQLFCLRVSLGAYVSSLPWQVVAWLKAACAKLSASCEGPWGEHES